MIGYPKFIMDPKELDKVFNDVSRVDDVPWVSFFPFPPTSPRMCRMCVPMTMAQGQP